MSDFLDQRKAQHMGASGTEGIAGTVEGVPPPPGLEGVSESRTAEPTDTDRPAGASWWAVKYWKWMGPNGPEAVFCFACHGTFRGSWYAVAVPREGEKKDGILLRPLLEGGLMDLPAKFVETIVDGAKLPRERACWCPLGGRRFGKVFQRATLEEAEESAREGGNR